MIHICIEMIENGDETAVQGSIDKSIRREIIVHIHEVDELYRAIRIQCCLERDCHSNKLNCGTTLNLNGIRLVRNDTRLNIR